MLVLASVAAGLVLVVVASKSLWVAYVVGTQNAEGVTALQTLAAQGAAVQEQKSVMTRRCDEWLSRAVSVSSKSRRSPASEKEQMQMALTNYAECMGSSHNYLREMDVLLKRHASLLEAKEAEKR